MTRRLPHSSPAALKAAIFLGVLGAMGAAPSQAQISHNVVQVSEAPVIDGLLDEPAWKGADSLVLVTNNGPGGQKPKTATSVRVLWSATHLYVAFKVETPRIEGTITKHDGELYTQDVVEMFIDPDADSKNYMELEWNCLNTSLDYRFSGVRQGQDMAWSMPNSKSAVKLRGTANMHSDVDTGLTYEISLAWADMKAWSTAPMPPRVGDQLSANFYRIDYPPGNGAEELIAWSPTGAADFHRPDKFGRLVFAGAAAALKPGKSPETGHKARTMVWNGGVPSAGEARPILRPDGKVTWELPGRRLPPGLYLSGASR